MRLFGRRADEIEEILNCIDGTGCSLISNCFKTMGAAR